MMNGLKAMILAGLALLALAGCSTTKPATKAPANVRVRRPNPTMDPITDVRGLPRVLLIGDSISIGYTLTVRQELKGIANVHRIPENGGPTIHGLERLDAWLGKGRWDVIHFNWGLHDLKFMTNGLRQVSPADYETHLAMLVDRLKQTGATLIWASTTPVPPGVTGPPRDPADVLLYNAAAQRVMQSRRIRTNDLYTWVLPRLATLQAPRNVHFTEAGSAELGREVARRIRAVLPGR